MNTYRHPHSLVSPRWLSRHLDDSQLRIFDARWFLPSAGRDALAEYHAGHIPGAQFFDINAVCDHTTSLPHMLPTADDFADHMQRIGMDNDHRIIIYDDHGAFGAPRVWWMLQFFGHSQCAVLNGGLPAWKRLGLPLEAIPPKTHPLSSKTFTTKTNPTLLADYDDVAQAHGNQKIIDVRSPGRFSGQEKEPRPHLRSGHIPTSINLHYDRLIDANGAFLNPRELNKLIHDHGITMDQTVIATCGSGITACSLAFALHLLGHENVAVYDGSWCEWGSK